MTTTVLFAISHIRRRIKFCKPSSDRLHVDLRQDGGESVLNLEKSECGDIERPNYSKAFRNVVEGI